MSTTTHEHLQNPDELLAYNLRYEHVHMLKLQPLKADQAVEHMLRTQEKLGVTASNHFVPKDYTKPQYEALQSEPAPAEVKKDAFEQALVNVKSSSLNTTPEIDEDLARMLVEQSVVDTPENAARYVHGGIQQLEDYVHSQERSYIHDGIQKLENFANSQEKTNAR